ncbi:unnamed protein product [Adineta ricciae]|uniref:Glycine amidinotransferase n=1 Tax=Adineta ricciae TaxID=249248 RepID=A0A815PDX5_ADIRI|nr:unnamed protein product [Adineta ricciae]
MSSSSIVNSWTEWGQLETICIGTAQGMCYPDETPAYSWHTPRSNIRRYINSVIGPRPRHRIEQAQQQLDNLADLLRAETVRVCNFVDEIFNEDIEQSLKRKRTVITDKSEAPPDGLDIMKGKIEVCRPDQFSDEKLRFNHQLSTPHFKSQYQYGLSCPRDVLITMGDTILEAPVCAHTRYFETEYYKPLLYSLWNRDSRMKWLQPPKPTCSPELMFNHTDYREYAAKKEISKSNYGDSGYKTNLNENEIAFDAADMIRMGKDVFYKKSASANNQGLHWLRRVFPHLRFHMIHFPSDDSSHLDYGLMPLRPPTSGSEGLVLLNQKFLPLASEMKIFTDNDWRPIWAPLGCTTAVAPLSLCSPSFNTNFLSLNDRCIVMEECELPLYHLLHDDLGFDVITCPFRTLLEFGGSIHCVTWDIRRDDSCTDHFPNQDYEGECKMDLNHYFDSQSLSPESNKKP